MYVILVYDIKSDQGGAKVLAKTFNSNFAKKLH